MTLGSDNANAPYVSKTKKMPVMASFEQSTLNERIKHIEEYCGSSRKESVSKDIQPAAKSTRLSQDMKKQLSPSNKQRNSFATLL